MATLILFDIDGTLAATSEADNRCFAEAFEAVFGSPIPTTDWHAYTHVTDLGILQEIVHEMRELPLAADESGAFQAAYLDRLQAAATADPGAFAEVPGARDLVLDLAETGGVGIATGGFQRTALFKLATIGLDGRAYPAAFSNDGLSREAIMRKAIERTGRTWEDIVYIGDGLWDMHASATLGVRFVGMVHEKGPDHFRRHGVKTTLDDYACRDAFWRAVEVATVPPPCRA